MRHGVIGERLLFIWQPHSGLGGATPAEAALKAAKQADGAGGHGDIP